jgi:FlaA1/EpsC-like NDP-sugar epimerase
MSVYDPKRIYKAADEFQNVAIGTGLAALGFAGLLHFAFRNISRTLFITFVLTDTTLLIGWRAVARLGWRVGRASPTRHQVLIVGAGKVGRQVAQMVPEHARAGVTWLPG